MKGFFVPIESESTDAIHPLFKVTHSRPARKHKREIQLRGLIGFCVACFLMSAVERVQADSSVGHVYLSGQVHQQGAVEIPEGGKLTLTQAIITEDGLGDFADPLHIKIIRKKSDGSSQVIHVDWIAIVGRDVPDHPAPSHLEKDVALQAGDMIVVPTR